MARTVLYMSVSLDGFIAGPNEGPGNGLGDGGMRLHRWIIPENTDVDLESVAANLKGSNRDVFDELMSTGAVVAGRGTFEPARGWNGDHHKGVPIYILSRHAPPDWASRWSQVHYTSDLAAAMSAARRAAGDTDVLVHGAGIAQRAIRQGLLDEIQLQIVPVLLGDGRLLFDTLGLPQRELDLISVRQGDGGIVHLRYRVAG